MASYRYRAKVPVDALQWDCKVDARLNDWTADCLVFAKPNPLEFQKAIEAKEKGKGVIVDFCDDHFRRFAHYAHFARLADAVTCPTEAMRRLIWAYTCIESTVIPDPYEYPLVSPHCNGVKLLWFGHAVNYPSLQRVLPHIAGYPLRVVSNVEGTIPWSKEIMLCEFLEADIVILPATALYKSPNRCIEAVRQGCFVVAEPHPALDGFPGIWIGNIKEGIEWARQNPAEARERTAEAQKYVSQKFAPRTLAYAWKTLLDKVKSRSTLAAGESAGQAGSMSISAAPT